jgi:hypothetical protein
MARLGKIARLPNDLREEVNRRLLDGETSRAILKWLNAQPAAVAIWNELFEGVPASAQNLSEWRSGGYAEWRGRRDRVENLKTLSGFASDLAKSGGSIADGAASIVAGQILEALENAGNIMVTGGSDDAEKDPLDGLAKIAAAVASLQKATTSRGKLELDKKRVRQKDRQLNLDQAKFETQTVAKFLEWARSPEAQSILDSGKPKDVVLSDLRQLMFGDRPSNIPAAP